MSTLEHTPTADQSTNCPHGDQTCPGPDPADWQTNDRGFPCFDCYTAATCPAGNQHCRHSPLTDATDAACWECFDPTTTTTRDVQS